MADQERDEPLHEWQCPSCGATTRALMSDQQPVPVSREELGRAIRDAPNGYDRVADALLVDYDITRKLVKEA